MVCLKLLEVLQELGDSLRAGTGVARYKTIIYLSEINMGKVIYFKCTTLHSYKPY